MMAVRVYRPKPPWRYGHNRKLMYFVRRKANGPFTAAYPAGVVQFEVSEVVDPYTG